MKLHTLNYPNRADMLALLKAREGGASAVATSRADNATGANRPEAPICLTVPPNAAR